MVTVGDIRNNVDIQTDYVFAYYDYDYDELLTLQSFRTSDFDDCDIQYIYYDMIDGKNYIVFEVNADDVQEVFDTLYADGKRG